MTQRHLGRWIDTSSPKRCKDSRWRVCLLSVDSAARSDIAKAPRRIRWQASQRGIIRLRRTAKCLPRLASEDVAKKGGRQNSQSRKSEAARLPRSGLRRGPVARLWRHGGFWTPPLRAPNSPTVAVPTARPMSCRPGACHHGWGQRRGAPCDVGQRNLAPALAVPSVHAPPMALSETLLNKAVSVSTPTARNNKELALITLALAILVYT